MALGLGAIGAASPARAGAPVDLVSLPVLDAQRGEQALVAYGGFVRRACAGGELGAAVRARLDAAKPYFDPCVSPAPSGRAIASGSFVEPRADEVLLEVASGMARAGGDRALVLLRRRGARYRFVSVLQPGEVFEAWLRIGTLSGLDALVLCNKGGNMGIYPGACGLFGQGAFRAGESEPGLFFGARGNDVPTVELKACGKGASVTVEGVSLDGDGLRFDVVLERQVRTPGPGDEGVLCSREKIIARERFTIDYRFDGRRFRRSRAVPRALLEPLP
jgi:hypothetical protein